MVKNKVKIFFFLFLISFPYLLFVFLFLRRGSGRRGQGLEEAGASRSYPLGVNNQETIPWLGFSNHHHHHHHGQALRNRHTAMRAQQFFGTDITALRVTAILTAFGPGMTDKPTAAFLAPFRTAETFGTDTTTAIPMTEPPFFFFFWRLSTSFSTRGTLSHFRHR